MAAQSRIVIIGTGVAGVEAAFALREFGHEGPITLIGREPHLPYERPPLSKAYLNGSLARDQLLLRPRSAYAEERIELKLGMEVAGIDRRSHALRLVGGEVIGYDQLLLAVGGEPRRVPLPGADLAGVVVLKTLDDVDEISPRLRSGAEIVVVGGGYVGMEFAATACQLGCRVTVLESQSRILSRTLPNLIGEHLQQQHESRGVSVLAGVQVTAFEGDTQVRAVVLADGRRLVADMVLVGIGNRASDALALQAGIEVSGGIVVDGDGRTNDADIFAAGDCTVCRHPGFADALRLESVQNANFQGRRAAAAMRSRDSALPITVGSEIPWFWSNQFDIKLQMVGLPLPGDAKILRGEVAGGSFSVVFQNADGVTAVYCVNAPADFAGAKKLIAERRAFDPVLLSDSEISLREIRSRAVAPAQGA